MASMHKELCMPQGDASPSKMGTRIATQVWAVAFLAAIRYRCFDAHVLPSQAPRACNGLNAVTLGGAYAAVPAR
jgi:hypothetical protein